MKAIAMSLVVVSLLLANIPAFAESGSITIDAKNSVLAFLPAYMASSLRDQPRRRRRFVR